MKTKKVVNSVNLLLILTLIFASMSSLYAHDGTNHEGEEVHYNSVMKIMPFFYFAQGDIFGGILITIFWIGLLYGLYNLIIILLGRILFEE